MVEAKIRLDPDTYGGGGRLVTAHDAAGRQVGRLLLRKPNKDGFYCAARLEVDDDFQRQGIATKMFDLAARHGLKIIPSDDLSPDSYALWYAHQKKKGQLNGAPHPDSYPNVPDDMAKSHNWRW